MNEKNKIFKKGRKSKGQLINHQIIAGMLVTHAYVHPLYNVRHLAYPE